MSTTICMYNFEYNGQVYSPAFSDPPSPKDSDEEHETSSSPPPTSPLTSSAATSWQRNLKNKRTADNMSESGEQGYKFVNKKPKYPTKFHEMLQPLSPVTTLPVDTVVGPVPSRTHQSKHDAVLQEDLYKLVRRRLQHFDQIHDLETFLMKHSENVDLNQYSSLDANDPDGGLNTFHMSCQHGDLPMAKLLIRFGANPKLTTREGFSTLHLAAFSGNSDLLFYVMSLKDRS